MILIAFYILPQKSFSAFNGVPPNTVTLFFNAFFLFMKMYLNHLGFFALTFSDIVKLCDFCNVKQFKSALHNIFNR